jgi:hypothetical protein
MARQLDTMAADAGLLTHHRNQFFAAGISLLGRDRLATMTGTGKRRGCRSASKSEAKGRSVPPP